MRIRYNSPVILSYTLLSTAVLVIGTAAGSSFVETYFAVYPTFQFNSLLSYIRLFTHVAGHANWMHLIANFSFVLLIGPILEEKYGSRRILAMILGTALITGILNVIFFPSGLMGASSIVFMLILLSSFTNIRSGEIPITFVLVVILFLTKEIVNAFSVEDNISQFAHIIGGICGGFFGFLITYKKSEPAAAEPEQP